MADLTEDQLNDLTDEELEQAVRDVRDEPVEEATEEPAEEAEVEVDAGESEEDVTDTDVGESDDEPVDEVDEENSETPEPEIDNPDGEPVADEGEKKEETPETPTFKDLKVNGNMVPINSIEELYALASGGGHMTQQLQALSSKKKSFAMMEQHGISDADISMLAEIKSGNKDALATLLKQSGVESMDIPDEVAEGYQPGQFIPSDQSMNLKAVQDEISMDQEYAVTQNIVNNIMDQESQRQLVKDPLMIKQLHQDVKSGAYERVSGEAMKLKMMDGGLKSDMDYYIQAAQSGGQPPQQMQTPPTQQPAPVRNNTAAKKQSKKSAGSTRAKTPPDARKSAEDMSDDELMAMRASIMDRSSL